MKSTLKAIYKCDGSTYYEVVKFNDEFTELQSCIMSFEELQSFLQQNGEKGCDFSIVDGMLKCNPVIRALTIDKPLLQSLKDTSNDFVTEIGRDSIYYLFEFGMKNNLVIVSDANDEEGLKKGYNVAPFRKIMFSSSTMTVYAQMHNEDGIYNHMVVTFEDGVLAFKPFVVGVDGTVSAVPGCTDLKKSVEINNVKYKLFKTDMLSVYDNVLFAPGTVNQACYESVLYGSLGSVCTDFIKGVTAYLSADKSCAWSGGGKSYKSDAGVYFKSSQKAISTEQRQKYEGIILQLANEGLEYQDIIARVESSMNTSVQSSSVLRMCIRIFAQIVTATGTISDRLAIALDAKKQAEEKKFWKDMYTYRVRASAFLHKYQLVPYSSPVLTGGQTSEVTIVAANYF